MLRSIKYNTGKDEMTKDEQIRPFNGNKKIDPQTVHLPCWKKPQMMRIELKRTLNDQGSGGDGSSSSELIDGLAADK